MDANPRTTGRTDLRTTDEHAGWRDVYAALDCPAPDQDQGGDGDR